MTGNHSSTQPAARPPVDARGATVVVVDDQPAIVALLERFLDATDVAFVHGFTDPRQALDHCAGRLPDLILLDLHMPDLDGFAFMAALKELVPDDGFLPVLVLTADVSTAVKEQALASGAKDFLTKPVDRTEVLLRVNNLLETRALYARLKEHSASLSAALDAHTAAERAAAEEDERSSRRIDQALAPDALTLVFQPIYDIVTGELVGAEALARFAGPPSRPPNEWFAEAEAIGRGAELELAAVARALERIHLLPADTFLAINASPATAAVPAFEALLSRYPGERIVVELTEHERVHDYDELMGPLDRMRGRGIRIAVDDTGAGYAGLQHLLRIRPDILKLDTTLTRGIDADPARRALAAALVGFAGEIEATIIAEGIEVASELTTLQGIGIPWGQGYHLARPGPLPLQQHLIADDKDPNP